MNPTPLRLLLLFPLAFVGALAPVYAQTRRGILFGITVPVDFPHTPTARAAIRRYRLRTLLLITLTLALAALLLWTIPFTGILPSLIPGLGTLLEILATYALWRAEANALRTHAAIVPLERIADLTAPSLLSPTLASAAALLPLAAAALWLKAHLAQLPARWPQHWTATGFPDHWGTPATAFQPLLAGAATILFLTAMSLFLARASGPQPTPRRRSLVPLAALTWLIAGSVATDSLQPLLHLSTSILILLTVVYLTATLALSLWMILRTNLTLTASSTLPYDSTPDSHWRAGLFYYNPSDASILVPKRFGLGWSLNFAHPVSWLCLAAILIFCVIMAVLNR